MTCLKRIHGLAASAGLSLAIGVAAVSAQPPKDTKPAPAQPSKPADAPKDKAQPPAGMPDMAEMMKKWEAYKTPGPQHAALAKAAGNWTTASKHRMSPEMPWEESTGTAKKAMILDGHYLQEESTGTMELPGADGKPQKFNFKGQGTFGYNNASKQYEGSWVDNMGTGVMYMTGKSTDNGKTVEWTSTFEDPMKGGKSTMRMVGAQTDDDHFTLKFYEKGMDGKEFNSMEITYTRKK